MLEHEEQKYWSEKRDSLVHNFKVVVVFAQGIQHRLVRRIEFAILEEGAQHLAGESRDHGHILFLLRDRLGTVSTSQVPEDDAWK